MNSVNFSITVSFSLGRWEVHLLQVLISPVALQVALLAVEDLWDTGWMQLPAGLLSARVEPWIAEPYLGLRVMGMYLLRGMPTDDGFPPEGHMQRLWVPEGPAEDTIEEEDTWLMM